MKKSDPSLTPKTGERLSVEWIEGHSYLAFYVDLISAYRICAETGLVNAKAKIDDCKTPIGFSQTALLELFAPWLLSEKEVAEAKEQLISKQENKKIFDAMECACLHWRILGFNSKIDACLSILRNLQGII